jgi:hypothetical protein
MKISSELSNGYLMVSGTLFAGALMGLAARGFKLNKSFTTLLIIGGLIGGGVLTSKMLDSEHITE